MLKEYSQTEFAQKFHNEAKNNSFANEAKNALYSNETSSHPVSKEKSSMFYDILGKAVDNVNKKVGDVYEQAGFLLKDDYEIVKTYHLRKPAGFDLQINKNYPLYEPNDMFLGILTDIDPRGGMTIVVIQNKETKNYHIGVSHCSVTDCYNKRTGRLIATRRAYEAMQQNKLYGLPYMQCNTVMSAMMRSVYHTVDPRYLTKNAYVLMDVKGFN